MVVADKPRSQTIAPSDQPAKAAKIDVHFHPAPPVWLKDYVETDVDTVRRSSRFGAWSVAKTIEDMDKSGCATVVSSITNPGVRVPKVEDPVRLARECNEYMAGLAADHPGRFGMFAILPLPDIDASLKEIAYALDVLKADGIGLYTNYHDSGRDKWLGDPFLEPIFEELHRRQAVVFTHPTEADCCRGLLPGISSAAIEYGTHTTRAIAQYIFSGASQRYSDVRMIFSHAGGTMPFLISRFINLGTGKFRDVTKDGFIPEASKLFYDTAQTPVAAPMLALRSVVPPSQIVFGSDYPYRGFGWTASGLENINVFGRDELDGILRTNALRLLPRFGR